MAEKKVAVIGGGLGGLSAAIKLADLGLKVALYEKNSFPGGKAGEIRAKGFRFDTGPSLLTMPYVLKELFDAAGKDINDYLQLEKLAITCKYFYPDGLVFNAYSDLNKLGSEVEAKTIDTIPQLKKYLGYAKTIYELSAELFLYKSFTELKTFCNLKALNTLLNIKKLDTNRTMHEAVSSFFNDDRLIQLFDRYATYNGSNPYKAPATLNIIPHVEYNEGGFTVKNGIYEISRALEALAEEKGVTVFYNSPVKKIEIEKGRVKGIIKGNQTLYYNIIVSNADAGYTYSSLLNDTSSRSVKKNNKLDRSSSAIVFYWGINDLHPELETHNIIFTENYKNEFEKLFDEETISDDPTIYIYISSKRNAQDAPSNMENWFVMINVPNTSNKMQINISRIRKQIIQKIEQTLDINIESKIIFEETLLPSDIEKNTNSMFGSIYGVSSNSKRAAFLRQQNKSKEYKGLYFCGGSVHPGGGIPLVLLSGKIVAELVKKYEL